MSSKSVYGFQVATQDVDFTLRASILSVLHAMLNTAGQDAYGKGFGVDALLKANHSWVLSRMAVELERLPCQFEKYDIATWISDYGRLLSTRNFTLTDAQGVEFGQGVTQWAMIDMERRRAVDLSWVGKEHEEAVVPIPPQMEMPRKIRGVEPTLLKEHQVVYSDIDFNRHVNALRYLELMFDELPIEMLAWEKPLRLDVHFMKESRYGDTLQVGVEVHERGALCEVKTTEGVVSLRAEIEWK